MVYIVWGCLYIVVCVSILFGVLCVPVWIGRVEAMVLASLIEANGSLGYVRAKGEVTGYGRLIPGIVPVSELKKVRYLHCSYAHAVRSLTDKGLIRVDGKGSRKRLTLNWQTLGALAISRTAIGRRELG